MDRKELKNLISHWLDGACSEEELRALDAALTGSREARHTFLIMARFHAEFCSQAEGQEMLEALNAEETAIAVPAAASVASEVPVASDSGRSVWRAFAIAAALLMALGLWWTNGESPQVAVDTTDKTTEVEQPSALAEAPAILKAIEPTSAKCRWYVEEVSRAHAGSCQAGDVIRVTHGSLSLEYGHGTNVVLHSPAAYQLLSSTRARMIIGRLTATVPEAGKGFTVITPQANVIDLGTEFGVEVSSDGATDVVVFKGEVDLDYHEKGAEAQRLRMGEALRLDAVGTASRLVSINGEEYSNKPLEERSRPPVITRVRDNIRRESSFLNFYEIIHEGLREDALSHVDRISHQYNGITKKGIPDYLLGADYVKTFNSDKFLRQNRIIVAIDRPAKLYVFFDNRHDPPKWLTNGFVDTGDDIGLDNGPFQTNGIFWHNKGPSGIGPGESIDDELSIWVQEIKSPGLVRLGPLGTTVEVGANMYGIAALPIDDESDSE